MSPDTLSVYRHSGKFHAWAPALAVGAAALAGLPLGYAYAYAIRWIPFIYINFFVTVGYGFAFGWLGARLMKAGHVRNPRFAALCGLTAGLIGLYGEWSAHLHVVFDDAPWFFTPAEVLRGMSLLYESGSWSLHNEAVTGIPLALVWLVEAAIIVGIAAATPWALVRDTPYCEQTRCWLDESKPINTLEPITDAAARTALQSGDLMPIVHARPKAAGANNFTRLLLKRSERCQVFCTLRVQDIALSLDSKGNVKEKVTDLSGDLIIPASMFDLIAQFEHFASTPPAAPA
jgi:hypothetical protein